MAASSARVVADIQHDAADIGLVRDLGGQHLDRDRIGKGQGGRLLDVGIERDRRRVRNAEAVEQRIGFEFVEHAARAGRLADRTAIGLGARRCSAAAIASAQASGVWKFGTPAAASRASASGASGTRNAAIGLAASALSMIGLTARSG